MILIATSTLTLKEWMDILLPFGLIWVICFVLIIRLRRLRPNIAKLESKMNTGSLIRLLRKTLIRRFAGGQRTLLSMWGCPRYTH